MARVTAFEKYLTKRALTTPWQLEGLLHERKLFSAAIVIPALAEYENLTETIFHLSLNPPELLAKTLVIVVVNNRKTATISDKEQNQFTLAWLNDNHFPKMNIRWVDASSAGLELPAKDGVGLARKIGFDLALAQIDMTSLPLLISLDADTQVDANYLSAIFCHFSCSAGGAAVVPFRHQVGATVAAEKAIRHYELYLRSYQFGLQLAKSPYAYHTIGSAFACTVDAYVASAGMNRRLAGEDFYFLQQLQKTSGVELLRGTVVRPSARCSDRVPFGTGRVVEHNIATGTVPYTFVSVTAFKILHGWIDIVTNGTDKSASDILSLAQELSLELYSFISELSFTQVWLRLQRNCSTTEQRLRAFHGWFDALRTRQLLTRIDVDDLSVIDIVGGLLGWGGFNSLADEAEQLVLLEKVQGVR